jgi:diguanylate cyclase (GGDEF)-like protein
MDVQPEYQPLPRDRCTLTVLTGPNPGALYTVGPGHTILGRDEALAWRIPDRGVSSYHARIYAHQGMHWLEDLDSTNGTHVNGTCIEQPQPLRDGDRVQLGENTLLRVSIQDATEHEAARRMYQAAVLDPLTGVYNRGHLESVLVAEYAFAVRHHTALSVVFVDLDHFSAVNNNWGHLAGDAVLRAAAQTIRQSLRLEDLVARYGGEEFVMVARGIDSNAALVMAERVRQELARMSVPFGHTELRVTASFGVASYDARTAYPSVDQLVSAADRAVYRAKAEGRNRVCAAHNLTLIGIPRRSV